MSDDKYDVVLAVFAIDEAKKNFGALVELVEDKKVTTAEYLLLVVHDNDGEIHVTDAADHIGREGLIRKFIEHRIDSGIKANLGEKLPKGFAGVIAMVGAADSAATKAALAGSVEIAVSQVEAKGTKGLEEGLKDAAKPGSLQAPKSK